MGQVAGKLHEFLTKINFKLNLGATDGSHARHNKTQD